MKEAGPESNCGDLERSGVEPADGGGRRPLGPGPNRDPGRSPRPTSGGRRPAPALRDLRAAGSEEGACHDRQTLARLQRARREVVGAMSAAAATADRGDLLHELQHELSVLLDVEIELAFDSCWQDIGGEG